MVASQEPMKVPTMMLGHITRFMMKYERGTVILKTPKIFKKMPVHNMIV
jgi:hypothetical protein